MTCPDFDAAQIHDYAAVMPVSALKELAVSFRSSVSELIDQLTHTTRHLDPDRLAAHAHDLKGVSGSFGARRLQNLAEQLEKCCRESLLTGVAPILAAMPEAALHAFSSLETELEKLDLSSQGH